MADTTVPNKRPRRLALPPRKRPKTPRGRFLVPLDHPGRCWPSAGYELLKYFGSYESTDDAQMDGHVNADQRAHHRPVDTRFWWRTRRSSKPATCW